MSPARRQPSNLPASVHARLLRLAKQSDANFNVVLVRFATERLLYRLSRSPHADRFVLKGAWLFYVWDLERRVTRDLDLLGFGNASPAAMEEVFREVLGSPVEPDGIEFDDAELQVAEMREGAAYPKRRLLGPGGVNGLDERPGLPHRFLQRLLRKLQPRSKLRVEILPECHGLQGGRPFMGPAKREHFHACRPDGRQILHQISEQQNVRQVPEPRVGGICLGRWLRHPVDLL